MNQSQTSLWKHSNDIWILWLCLRDILTRFSSDILGMILLRFAVGICITFTFLAFQLGILVYSRISEYFVKNFVKYFGCRFRNPWLNIRVIHISDPSIINKNSFDDARFSHFPAEWQQVVQVYRSIKIMMIWLIMSVWYYLLPARLYYIFWI